MIIYSKDRILGPNFEFRNSFDSVRYNEYIVLMERSIVLLIDNVTKKDIFLNLSQLDSKNEKIKQYNLNSYTDHINLQRVIEDILIKNGFPESRVNKLVLNRYGLKIGCRFITTINNKKYTSKLQYIYMEHLFSNYINYRIEEDVSPAFEDLKLIYDNSKNWKEILEFFKINIGSDDILISKEFIKKMNMISERFDKNKINNIQLEKILEFENDLVEHVNSLKSTYFEFSIKGFDFFISIDKYNKYYSIEIKVGQILVSDRSTHPNPRFNQNESGHRKVLAYILSVGDENDKILRKIQYKTISDL